MYVFQTDYFALFFIVENFTGNFTSIFFSVMFVKKTCLIYADTDRSEWYIGQAWRSFKLNFFTLYWILGALIPVTISHKIPQDKMRDGNLMKKCARLWIRTLSKKYYRMVFDVSDKWGMIFFFHLAHIFLTCSDMFLGTNSYPIIISLHQVLKAPHPELC